jgi:hypothetical protein
MVLVVGGIGLAGNPLSTELYDPASGTWAVSGNLATKRARHTATLLLNGTALVAGGHAGSTGLLHNAELYDAGLDFDEAWRPQITRASLSHSGGNHVRLAGVQFQGISQASGGNTQDSSSNYPIVQLRSLDNSQVAFLPVEARRGWTETSFYSLPVKGFPPGPAQVTIFTNGIPSVSQYLVVPERGQ